MTIFTKGDNFIRIKVTVKGTYSGVIVCNSLNIFDRYIEFFHNEICIYLAQRADTIEYEIIPEHSDILYATSI